MSTGIAKYYLVAIMLLMIVRCKKPYEPAVLIKGDSYLVIDGFINTSPNGITSITLSRTKNLTDTVINIPELGAKVTVQNAVGTSYDLQEQGGGGNYVTGPLQLSNSSQYKILVTTSGG